MRLTNLKRHTYRTNIYQRRKGNITSEGVLLERGLLKVIDNVTFLE